MTMLRPFLLFVSFLQVFSDPLLIWSESDLQSLLDVPLGAKFNGEQFQDRLLQPVCNDHKVVLFDVPDVTYKDLVLIAGKDSSQWPSMKSQLSKAVFEKVLEYKGGVGSGFQSGCDLQHVPIPFNPQEDEASVAVDDEIKKQLAEENPVSGNSKPVVYILRSISSNGDQDEEGEENLVRRSAEAALDPQTDPNPNSGFLSHKCYRMYFDRIDFQVLLPAFKEVASAKVNRFAVNGWTDDGSSCAGADLKKNKEMTIKLKAATPGNNKFSNIKVEMVVKAYGKYGASGKSFKYWYADSMKLSYSYDGKDAAVSRISPGYIAAPQDYSYACQRPDNQPLGGATANLIFTNLQFDANMVIDGTDPVASDKFNDGIDCEARLGKGGIVALFFIVIVLFTTLYIIAMLSSAKNPVFGDKQIVVNQE